MGELSLQKPSVGTIVFYALLILGVFLVYQFFGEKVAALLGVFGLGGEAAVKGVKKRAKKKHDLIADDPDAIQRDNLDKLRRRKQRKT
jgi:hypothetical protein